MLRAVLHRDIKPENIIVGKESSSEVLYLVDYGISKYFRDVDGQHIPFTTGKPFLGTTRYASVAAHVGEETSRKDDLESLGYVLVYLFKGLKLNISQANYLGRLISLKTMRQK